MPREWVILVVAALILGAGFAPARADDPPQFPQPVTFFTLSRTTLAIEGLTGDDAGNLYTTGRATPPTRCPVWRIDSAGTPPVTPVQIGSIPNAANAGDTACNPSGIAFDHAGNLYIADAATVNGVAGAIWKLTATNMIPTNPFATGVPGTNGLAFDRDGHLWTGDGTTGQGRVWRITPAGVVTEVFRIQPMANPQNVGRQNSTVQPAPAGPNPQPLVANGLAFNPAGDLLVADTARGAIWKVQFDSHGNLESQTNCDTTFTTNTLCLDNVFVAHPYLEGTDGIALDRAGNIWNSANERNAIVVVTNDGRVAEVFRNDPDAGTHLRNTGPLEFPTSPVLFGRLFCTSNSDGNRRDNSPNTAGEVSPTGAFRGKISCMHQDLTIPGSELPVH